MEMFNAFNQVGVTVLVARTTGNDPASIASAS